MLIYMDLCCFNRPFDSQTFKTIYLETEAKLFIQDMIRERRVNLAWSYMMSYENSANPDKNKRDSIREWESLSFCKTSESDEILRFAELIHSKGLGVKDSLHLSCAVLLKAEFFITVDKGIQRKSGLISEIKIISPIDFITTHEGAL